MIVEFKIEVKSSKRSRGLFYFSDFFHTNTQQTKNEKNKAYHSSFPKCFKFTSDVSDQRAGDKNTRS